jgi:hypothetical protein
MHGLHVTEMHIGDLAVLPKVRGNLREHAALVGQSWVLANCALARRFDG